MLTARFLVFASQKNINQGEFIMARKSSVERANQMTGGFATARKNIIIQFGNKDRNTEDILKQIKEDVLSRGLSDSDFENVLCCKWQY